MSSSEFEWQHHWEEDHPTSFPLQGLSLPHLPDDFNEEDIAFAQEMESLFAIPDEDLPPYFVQTLLEADDPRFQVVEHRFEQKTCARVFRRLRLHRRLFSLHPFALRKVGAELQGQGRSKGRQPLLGLTAALFFLIFFTVMFTAPSFAEGLQILLFGGHTGVYQVNHYPDKTKIHHGLSHSQTETPLFESDQLTLITAQKQLHFRMSWPQFLPKNYSLSETYLYQGVGSTWADGPVLEFDYTDTSPITDGQLRGTRQIAISEFKLKPGEDIFQVVQLGAATPIQIDKDGQAKAIYVNGQWVAHNRSSYIWEYGKRAELIYQRDGIVFWIAGDQRDGINQAALWKIAQSLTVVDIAHLSQTRSHLIPDSIDPMHMGSSFARDVVAIFSNGANSLYFSQVGDDQQP